MRFLRKAVISGPGVDASDERPREEEQISRQEPAAGAASLDDEIAKLIDLRDGGTLTKVEFEARKAILLNSWGDGS